MIQWAAASKARAPKMVYYTYGDQNTVKVCISAHTSNIAYCIGHNTCTFHSFNIVRFNTEDLILRAYNLRMMILIKIVTALT